MAARLMPMAVNRMVPTLHRATPLLASAPASTPHGAGLLLFRPTMMMLA